MSKPVLQQLRIASPCTVRWEQMEGEGAVRFCRQCELNVYNLADMTEEEAVSLLEKTEGRTCVRLFRRDDGTIITRDCPVGRRAFYRQVAALAGAIAATLLVVGSGVLATAGLISPRSSGGQGATVFPWWSAPTPVTGSLSAEMGGCVEELPPAIEEGEEPSAISPP